MTRSWRCTSTAERHDRRRPATSSESAPAPAQDERPAGNAEDGEPGIAVAARPARSAGRRGPRGAGAGVRGIRRRGVQGAIVGSVAAAVTGGPECGRSANYVIVQNTLCSEYKSGSRARPPRTIAASVEQGAASADGSGPGDRAADRPGAGATPRVSPATVAAAYQAASRHAGLIAGHGRRGTRVARRGRRRRQPARRDVVDGRAHRPGDRQSRSALLPPLEPALRHRGAEPRLYGDPPSSAPSWPSRPAEFEADGIPSRAIVTVVSGALDAIERVLREHLRRRRSRRGRGSRRFRACSICSPRSASIAVAVRGRRRGPDARTRSTRRFGAVPRGRSSRRARRTRPARR